MIEKKDVQYISHLSRIHLKDQEAKKLAKNLEDILEYINKLNKLDVKNVEPTSHVLPLKNVFRDDVESGNSLPRNEVTKNAAEKENGFFKVPQVIE